MTDSDQLAVVRRFVEAFNRRDFEMIRRDVDPEVVLDEWQEAPGARSYRGPDGVQTALDSWFETWEWMQVNIEELREAGDSVFVVLHQRAKGSGSGIEVEIRSWNVYSFRDGKVIHIKLFLEPGPALEAAGLAPNYEEERR